jgi:hypothetical protein
VREGLCDAAVKAPTLHRQSDDESAQEMDDQGMGIGDATFRVLVMPSSGSTPIGSRLKSGIGIDSHLLHQVPSPIFAGK